MLIATDPLGERIDAIVAKKTEGPYRCPCCGQDVVLKQGRIVIHHFAHKPDSDCAHGKGETKQHREAKRGIAEMLQNNPKVEIVDVERIMADGCVADVYIELITGDKIAIELQRSQQTEAETIRRTQRYLDLGVYVMWVAVPLVNKLLVDNPSYKYKPMRYVYGYRPTAMEKHFSGLHMGTYFMWRSDTKTLHKATLLRMDRWVDGGGYGDSYVTSYKDRRELELSDPMSAANMGVKVATVPPWRKSPKRYPKRMIVVAKKSAA